jgi:hypothetical protein
MRMPSPAEHFAVIPLGPNDRPPLNCVAWGSWASLGPLLFDTRPLTAALDIAARCVAAAEAMKARETDEQQVFDESLTATLAAVDALHTRIAAIERDQVKRRKLDAETEAKHELLDIPKESAMRDEVPPPASELTPKPASQPEDKEQLAAGDQGNLPRELEVGAPPDPGTDPEFDPAKLGEPPETPPQRAPVAVSLN